MRKLLCLFIIWSLAFSLSAQGRYSLYEISGNVLCKKFRTSEWIVPSDQQELSVHDVFSIPSSSFVRIMDRKNQMVYTSLRTGEISVRNIVEEAEDKAGDITKDVNQYLLSSLSKNEKKELECRAYGVVYRDLDSDAPMSLYNEILLHVSDLRENRSKVSSKAATIAKVLEGKGLFYFRIRNNTDKIYYMNLLMVKGDEVTVCYDCDGWNPILKPGKDMDMSQYLFADSADAPVGYYLLLSEGDYKVKKIQQMLKNDASPSPVEYQYDIVVVPVRK